MLPDQEQPPGETNSPHAILQRILRGQERLESKLDAVKERCDHHTSGLFESLKKELDRLCSRLGGEDGFDAPLTSPSFNSVGGRFPGVGRLDTSSNANTFKSPRSNNRMSAAGTALAAKLALMPEKNLNCHSKDVVEPARRLHIRIERAELSTADNVSDATSSSCLSCSCIVKLDGKQIAETTSDFRKLEWNHLVDIAYAGEEKLELVIARAPFGALVHQPLATSSIKLQDDRFRSSFDDFIELIPIGESAPAASTGRIKIQLSWDEQELPNGDVVECSRDHSRQSTPNGDAVSARQSVPEGQADAPIRDGSRGSGCSDFVLSHSATNRGCKWPASITLREGLEESREGKENGEFLDGIQQLRYTVLQSGGDSVGGVGRDSGRESFTFQKRTYQINPSRLWNLYWKTNAWSPVSITMFSYSIASLLVLALDFVTIPYVLAWDVDTAGWFQITSWISSSFWLCDIFISFSTGYFSDGQIERRRRLVVKHYAQTWFMLDFPLVLVDMANVLVMSIAQGRLVQIMRLLKLPRFLRLVSLFRVFKLRDVFENMVVRDSSELWRAFLYILQLVLIILWLGHFCCCIWFYIGRGESAAQSWMMALDDGSTKFENAHPAYQYTTSFHWALAQISGSGVEVISPMNTTERLFNIGLCVFQILFGSFLVSTISAKVLEIQIAQQDKVDKTRMVRAFLKQNNIEPHLAIRIQKQLSERLSAEKRLRELDVSALDLLSLRIRMELRFAVVGKSVMRHPLFSFCTRIDMPSSQRVCYEAIEQDMFPRGEVLFMHNTDVEKVYLVVRGTFEYKQSAVANPHLDADMEAIVLEGRWMCRAALWTCWRTVGTAEANEVSDLLTMLPRPALQIFLQHPMLGDIMREYGAVYHRTLINAVPPIADYPNDLIVPRASFSEIIFASKSDDLRIAIGISAIMDLRNRRYFGDAWNYERAGQNLGKLEEEVKVGKSLVIIEENGDVQRIVSLALICLESKEGKVLAKMGSKKGDEMVGKPGWPGRPLNAGQDQIEALKQFFEEDFKSFLSIVDFPKSVISQQETEKQESGTYGISTEYISTLHFGRLLPTADLVPSKLRRMVAPCRASQFQSPVPLYHHEGSQRGLLVNLDIVMDIFLVPCKDGKGFTVYAWLPCKADLEMLRSHPAGKDMVKKWLDTLEVAPTQNLQQHSSSDLGGILPDGMYGMVPDGASKSNLDKVLAITVISASGLRDADTIAGFGISDPYCTVELENGSAVLARTTVKCNTSDPKWNEILSVSLDYVVGQSIVFKVWDKDHGKRDDFLGKAIVSSDKFIPNGCGALDLKLVDAGEGVDATLRVKFEVPSSYRVRRKKPADDVAQAGEEEAIRHPHATEAVRGGNNTEQLLLD